MSSSDQKEKAQLAGLVLGLLGCFTYGSTSPFGLVLNGEWIRDPDRRASLRGFDIFGLVLCIPGRLFFLYFSVAMFTYSPGGNGFAPMILIYWLAFAIWLLIRKKTRWLDITRRRLLISTKATTNDTAKSG